MSLFTFRVYVFHDEQYKYEVGYCLETGSVATANDRKTVLEMIQELLHDETAYALKHHDFRNLLSCPAPFDIWMKWKSGGPRKATMDINGNQAELLIVEGGQ